MYFNFFGLLVAGIEIIMCDYFYNYKNCFTQTGLPKSQEKVKKKSGKNWIFNKCHDICYHYALNHKICHHYNCKLLIFFLYKIFAFATKNVV